MSVSLDLSARSATSLPLKVVTHSLANRIKITLGTALALTCAFAIAVPQKANSKPIPAITQAKGSVPPGELSLSGLNFYFTEADLIDILGLPKGREVINSAYIDEVLYFGGISVAMGNGQVIDIVATSPKFCTPSGVCPGDSVGYAFNILGTTDIIGQEAVYYPSSSGSCSLRLGVSGNVVDQIKLACP